MSSLAEDLVTCASGKSGSLYDKSIRNNAPMANRHAGALVESDAFVVWKVTRRCDKAMAAQPAGNRCPY
jgi:hypothetical protein